MTKDEHENQIKKFYNSQPDSSSSHSLLSFLLRRILSLLSSYDLSRSFTTRNLKNVPNFRILTAITHFHKSVWVYRTGPLCTNKYFVNDKTLFPPFDDEETKEILKAISLCSIFFESFIH